MASWTLEEPQKLAFDQVHRTPGRHAVRGRLGAGSGRLRATSTSGHVALLRAPEVQP